MKDIYTLEDVDYIEFQTSDYSVFRVERNIIKEFSLKLKYDKVDVSICSDNSQWFKGIRLGADLGIRVTFAYLMKHNL